MSLNSDRSGRHVRQASGYRAFIPAPLPPNPPLQFDLPFVQLLSRADLALGRLDGIGGMLPNPNLFVAMYVRQEAVYSSQIEGTQSTLDDILSFELDVSGDEIPRDAEEVVNYVRALNYGLQRLATLPLSLRLIREIHAELMQGVRGAELSPGEFRTSQNWIGRANATLAQATFVPPPPAELMSCLNALESFLHADHGLPPLIVAGLAHAQFATIHPFLDGNGRVGRLLITLLLCDAGILTRPLLYLSLYLRRNRAEYYKWLTLIRTCGDWEGWVRFFLRGVAESAEDAGITAHRIVRLYHEHRNLVQEHFRTPNGARLLDLLFDHPLVTPGFVRTELEVAYGTASSIVESFVELGILEEITTGRRNRRFRYSPYLALFSEGGAESGDTDTPTQGTEP